MTVFLRLVHRILRLLWLFLDTSIFSEELDVVPLTSSRSWHTLLTEPQHLARAFWPSRRRKASSISFINHILFSSGLLHRIYLQHEQIAASCNEALRRSATFEADGSSAASRVVQSKNHQRSNAAPGLLPPPSNSGLWQCARLVVEIEKLSQTRSSRSRLIAKPKKIQTPGIAHLPPLSYY
jgi:hypothetical protein